jgi:hypothetical protein
MQAGHPVARVSAPVALIGQRFFLPDAFGDVVILQVEASTHAAAPVGLGHLRQCAAGSGINHGTRLAEHLEALFQVARIVVGDRPEGVG